MAKIQIKGKVESVKMLGGGDDGERYLFNVRDGERFSVFTTDRVLDSLDVVLPEVGQYVQVDGDFSVSRNGRYTNFTVNDVTAFGVFQLVAVKVPDRASAKADKKE